MNGTLTAGDLMAFTSLTWALTNPLRNLGVLINDVQRFFASCRMVIEIFYAQPTDCRPHAAAAAPKERPCGDVEFRNVSFRINGAPMLDRVNFRVPAGQTFGIMGATGSGKTTLVNLIDRVYDVTEGQVLLDGKDVREYTLQIAAFSRGHGDAGGFPLLRQRLGECFLRLPGPDARKMQ